METLINRRYGANENRMIGLAESPIATSASLGVMEALLIIHICLVAFQFLVRALIFDTTFYRDVLLVICVVMWAIEEFQSRRQKVKTPANLLDKLFSIYVFYGVLMIGNAIVNGVGPVAAATQFRNSFAPALLYFVAKKVFVRPEAQERLSKVFIVISIVFIVDVIGEYLVHLAGYPLAVIPWYPFMFKTSDRFVGNEVGAVGHINPDDSPILGLLGYPHYTVAALMALFAFSYPFLTRKRTKVDSPSQTWAGKVSPLWIGPLVTLLAVSAVLILEVRTHLITIAFVLMILPFFTNRKALARNTLIGLAASFVFFLVTLIEPAYVERLRTAIFSSGARDSSLSYILSVTEIKMILNSSVPVFLLGNADMGSEAFGRYANAFELKTLLFTAAFGVIWLTLFLGIYLLTLLYARRIVMSQDSPPTSKLFAVGTIGLLVVYILDAGHYARTMWAPNIDIWVVAFGTVSAIYSAMFQKKPKQHLTLPPAQLRARLIRQSAVMRSRF